MNSSVTNLPDGLFVIPPAELAGDRVVLRFQGAKPGDSSRGFVPYYHFRIFVDDVNVGHINVRVGETEHVRLAAGHIGFEIAEQHRGHGYALQACRAIAPFVRSLAPAVGITCDPDNTPSRRTIEKLARSL